MSTFHVMGIERNDSKNPDRNGQNYEPPGGSLIFLSGNQRTQPCRENSMYAAFHTGGC